MYVMKSLVGVGFVFRLLSSTQPWSTVLHTAKMSDDQCQKKAQCRIVTKTIRCLFQNWSNNSTLINVRRDPEP